MIPSQEGFFCVISICCKDLADFGFDVSGVTDEKVKELADRIGDFLVESGGFWDIFIEVADSMGIPRIEGVDRRGFCMKCGAPISMHNDDWLCVVPRMTRKPFFK